MPLEKDEDFLDLSIKDLKKLFVSLWFKYFQ